jgi:hypothetical protein
MPTAVSLKHADYGFDAPKAPIFVGLGGIATLGVAAFS